MTKTRKIFWGAWWGAVMATGMVAAMAGCGSSQAPNFPTDADATPASDSIGEALFLDTRFSEYFAANMTGVNDPLAVGDPVVSQVQTPNGPLPGPFAGQSINCRSCHFVTEFEGVANAGNRTYADFTTRSPLPLPMNGFDHTPRNAMQMVGSLQPHAGPVFLHFDGEFTGAVDLIESTMTGRNFGWGPTQYQQALAHIAQVIRQDNGSGQLAADRLDGLPYAVIFLGTDPRITSDILLPASQRLDVTKATDQQILDEMAMCISQYMKDLLFKQDEYGRYSTYGLLKEMPKKQVQSVIYQLVDQGLLDRAGNDRPTLTLNDASWEVMRGKREVHLIRPKQQTSKTRAGEESWDGVDRGLFEALRQWRRALATERGVPPFVVLDDHALRDLARVRPIDIAHLRGVHGIGAKRLADLGPSLIETIAAYCREQNIATNQGAVGVAPSAASGAPIVSVKSTAREAAFLMFSQGRPVEEVAATCDRAKSTTLQYLAEFIAERQPTSIDPWVHPKTQKRIVAAAADAESMKLRPIFDKMNGEVPFEEIRVVLAHLAVQAG